MEQFFHSFNYSWSKFIFGQDPVFMRNSSYCCSAS